MPPGTAVCVVTGAPPLPLVPEIGARLKSSMDCVSGLLAYPAKLVSPL
jgi:hypothetical protein